MAFSGYHDMSWNISSSGFMMTLSGYVPSIIAENIEPMLNNSLQQMGIEKSDIQHWAIHPGGKNSIRNTKSANTHRLM